MSIITNETYLRYFEEIAKIPHGSGNEKQLSDYLCRFARERGLKLEQDKYYNVVIYKPASKGYENHKPVALQAHIDMVEESDNEYDFSKGLQIYTEDGFIKAKDTTLGADDGIGVAMTRHLNIQPLKQSSPPRKKLLWKVPLISSLNI